MLASGMAPTTSSPGSWMVTGVCLKMGFTVYHGTLKLGIPVVPHKAVAEVSKIGNYRRGALL
jgi:hypothetical protein